MFIFHTVATNKNVQYRGGNRWTAQTVWETSSPNQSWRFSLYGGLTLLGQPLGKSDTDERFDGRSVVVIRQAIDESDDRSVRTPMFSEGVARGKSIIDI